mgnify:CR=1 FL=1
MMGRKNKLLLFLKKNICGAGWDWTYVERLSADTRMKEKGGAPV